MNVFEKRKKDCPFPSVNAKTKEGKHLAVNRQQSPLWAAKVLFTIKANGYGKSKNMNANQIRVRSSRLKLVHWSCSKIRLEEAEEECLQHRRCPPVSAGNELFAAHCSCLLVLGIFTNLAIIKKMFSLLRVKYLRSQSNDMAFTKLKE